LKTLHSSSIFKPAVEQLLVQETLKNKSECAWKKSTQDSTNNCSSHSHKCDSREDVERKAVESEKVGYWHNDAE